MIIKTFVFNPFQENTYVLHDEAGEAVVIDAGCVLPYECEELQEYIESNKLNLRRVLNTHLHIDHIFGNRFLSDTYGLQPEAHKDDEFLIGRFAKHMELFGLRPRGEAQPIGTYIADKQVITFGNISLTALHVPGHSPGSVAFYCEKFGCAFVGDVLFRGSIGRTDLELGDYGTLIRSIQDKLLVLPDSTVVYSGHGPETTIGYEKNQNPFL